MWFHLKRKTMKLLPLWLFASYESTSFPFASRLNSLFFTFSSTTTNEIVHRRSSLSRCHIPLSLSVMKLRCTSVTRKGERYSHRDRVSVRETQKYCSREREKRIQFYCTRVPEKKKRQVPLMISLWGQVDPSLGHSCRDRFFALSLSLCYLFTWIYKCNWIMHVSFTQSHTDWCTMNSCDLMVIVLWTRDERVSRHTPLSLHRVTMATVTLRTVDTSHLLFPLVTDY